MQTKCQNGEAWWNGKDGGETDLEYFDELKYYSTTNYKENVRTPAAPTEIW